MNFSAALSEMKSPVQSQGEAGQAVIFLFFPERSSSARELCRQNSSCGWHRCEMGVLLPNRLHRMLSPPQDWELNPSREPLNTWRDLCVVFSQAQAKDSFLSRFFHQILLRKEKICLFFWTLCPLQNAEIW